MTDLEAHMRVGELENQLREARRQAERRKTLLHFTRGSMVCALDAFDRGRTGTGRDFLAHVIKELEPELGSLEVPRIDEKAQIITFHDQPKAF